ncbi:MAG: DUF3794 domain-containing protein [Lachnospiraceae bacterium]|nr:DUF3794 domain-containing protein [Lachnospiraceae bacterium]
MDLLMKNIHMCNQTKRAATQITLDEDLNVPDVRPDVEMIIQSRENVNLEHTRAETGKLYLDGFMEVSILYMDDTKERRIQRLDTRLSFEETLVMEGLEPGETVRVRHETEDLNVSLINSRKLAVRALVSFDASVDEIYDLSAAVEVRQEETGKAQLPLCEKKQQLEYLQLEVQNKDILRVKEDVQLPSNKPDIREILWENVQFRGCRTRLDTDKLLVQGSLFLFVLYRAEDEKESLQWIEQTIPVEGTLSCTGAAAGLVPDIEVTLAGADLTAKEDIDGELRTLHLEGVLELNIRLYGTDTAELLSDVYSPEKNLEPVTEEETYESLVVRNESKCKAQGKIRIQSAKPRILQICHCSGTVRIDQTKIEAGMKIEGALFVSILYISADDTMPFSVLEGTIPFTYLAEAQGIDESCRYTLTANLDQLSAAMSDSEEIEIRATIALNLFAVRSGAVRCIREIQEQDYTSEQLEAIPGLTGYIVQEGESLWDIGKKYFQTPQQIIEMNGLSSDQIQKGECLILMKNVNPGYWSQPGHVPAARSGLIPHEVRDATRRGTKA